MQQVIYGWNISWLLVLPRATSIENKQTLMDVKKIYSWKKKKWK